MTQKSSNKITIMGGGLAGCFLATLLANRGYKVELFEKLSKEEISNVNSNRSYNITFLAYGIEMLKQAKIWTTIKPQTHLLKGASTQLSKNSKPIFTPTYDEKHEYYAISRSCLLTIMIDTLSKNPLVSLHFNTELLSIDRYEKTIIVENVKTKKIETFACDVVIGADGVNSLVRPFLQQGQDTSHSQEYSSGGYKQFTISKEQVDALQLQKGVSYTWSAQGKYILAFPNLDDSLASLLIYPQDNDAFDSLKTEKSIYSLINEDFPFLSLINKNIAEQLLANSKGVFVTIHTDPWYYKDFITLVGDAAHGFYPFFGQGTSAAFGDCMKLVELIDKYGTDWQKIFPLYQEARKKHMDALGELSKEGLMRYARNKRADFETIYDKLESIGHTLLPKYINPPIVAPVMNDPEHTADYVENAKRQRKIAKRIGASLAATMLVGLVAAYENVQTKKKN